MSLAKCQAHLLFVSLLIKKLILLIVKTKEIQKEALLC